MTDFIPAILLYLLGLVSAYCLCSNKNLKADFPTTASLLSVTTLIGCNIIESVFEVSLFAKLVFILPGICCGFVSRGCSDYNVNYEQSKSF